MVAYPNGFFGIGGGGGGGLALENDNSIIVEVQSSAALNGTALIAAYALAKTLTPQGVALSATNRASVILPPAVYDLGGAELALDTQFVDIIGMTSVPEHAQITSTLTGALTKGVINQTANDVKIANVHLKVGGAATAYAYYATTNLTAAFMDNVRIDAGTAGEGTRMGIIYSGVFQNIRLPSSKSAFVGATLSGYFSRITSDNDTGIFGAPNSSSGAGATLSGVFRHCVATSGNAYGGGFGGAGTASGTFDWCIGGSTSFGGDGTASGTFNYCKGGNSSFGGSSGSFATASGTFNHCIGAAYSFGGQNLGTASGTFRHCFGGLNSFGGTMSGTMINCDIVATEWGGTITGTVDGCRVKLSGTDKHAAVVGAGGRIYNCTLLATGTGKSVYAAGAVNAKVAHCRLNKGIDLNVTNDVGTPYNVDDTDIS